MSSSALNMAYEKAGGKIPLSGHSGLSLYETSRIDVVHDVTHAPFEEALRIAHEKAREFSKPIHLQSRRVQQ